MSREASLHILFVHASGSQDTDDSSQPLLRGLRGELPKDAVVEAPIMPDPDNPDVDAWGAAIRGHMAAIGEDFVAVGHSFGGSTLLKEIAERGGPRYLRGVVTMATPFWAAPDWGVPDYAVPEDIGPLKKVPLILYFSSDDDTVAIKHLDLYGALLPHAVLRRVSGTDHLFDRAPFDAIVKDIASLFGDKQ